ncbi:MAG TPA: aminotransferase class III-fold pyridoxal phosphate-dependent enzyme [Steroidobacteraceae bacterium]|nr:aminotransferase class III-fold pyridoxal phosphate-dependent enzyme [Steroidobacteraceae bacterium]
MVAREVYGVEAALTPLAGERDDNFLLRCADGSSRVLKILDAAADANSVDCQVRVLRHLAEIDPTLPVPRLQTTRAGEPVGALRLGPVQHSTLLIDFLPGRPLQASTAAPRLLSSLGSTLGRLDRALQGFFHPALAQSLVWDVRRLAELAKFLGSLDDASSRRRVGEVVAALVVRLPALRALPSQAIHGDCHASNLLVDEGSQSIVGIVDFGDMIHAPRVLEPAVAMSELLTEGLSSVTPLSELVRAYAEVLPLQAAEVECLYDLIAARHAVTLLVHAWRSQHDPVGARAVQSAASHAGSSLERLRSLGSGDLSAAWHEAAGTLRPAQRLRRRRERRLGAGAELFYDEPLHLVRGEDVWLIDAGGRRYLDVYNNVAHVGHSHPTVAAAIQRQTATLATHSRYLHEGIVDYAEALCARLPDHLDTCIFVNSGSEANDVAWRIAQSATGRKGALIMEHAYHGITDAVAALTPAAGAAQDPRVATLAAPPSRLHASDPPSRAQLAAAAADAEGALLVLERRGVAAAAFYLDTALTSNGIFDPPPAWLAEIATRVRAAGALIVADEVQYGLGRCGSHFWGFERRGLVPDLVTLGKPLGNGFPLGVVVSRLDIIEEFQAKYGFFSTFGGNAVAAAAGLAVLEVLEREQLQQNAADCGSYLRKRLEALAAEQPGLGEIRGAGLLLGLEIVESTLQLESPPQSAPPISGSSQLPAPARTRAKRIVNWLCAEHSILTGVEGPRGTVLKLRPPLTFRRRHADLLVEAIAATLRAVP